MKGIISIVAIASLMFLATGCVEENNTFVSQMSNSARTDNPKPVIEEQNRDEYLEPPYILARIINSTDIIVTFGHHNNVEMNVSINVRSDTDNVNEKWNFTLEPKNKKLVKYLTINTEKNKIVFEGYWWRYPDKKQSIRQTFVIHRDSQPTDSIVTNPIYWGPIINTIQ